MERLTKTDMEVLRFTGRQRSVRPEHIEQRFGVSRATAYRRLRSLTERGLLVGFDHVSPNGKVFAATREGLAATSLGLRPTEPTLAHLLHEEAMTKVVCGLERQHVDCLTEREIIARNRTERDGRHEFELTASRHGRPIRHRPDIVCEIPEHDMFIAIEVELTPKNVDRWRDILYAFDRRVNVDGFIGVLYAVGSSARGSRIAELVSETRLGERFQLRPLSGPEILDGLLEITNAETQSRQQVAA